MLLSGPFDVREVQRELPTHFQKEIFILNNKEKRATGTKNNSEDTACFSFLTEEEWKKL